MHVSRHVAPCAQTTFVCFNLFVLRCATRPLGGILMCSLLTPAFARILSAHKVLRGALRRLQVAHVPYRVLHELLLRFLHCKLAQMSDLPCLTMVTWPFARTLSTVLVRLRMRRTGSVLAFCFRRWHSVHDMVTLLSFCACIAEKGCVER